MNLNKLLFAITTVAALQLVTIDQPVAQARRGLGDTYPVRPIRMIIASEAGSTQDVFARFLGEKLTEAWGQRVVIDNRAGAGGVIGYEIVSRAQPDGYTIKAGRLRVLAVTAARRFPAFPDVPTMAEAAGVPGFELDNWSAVIGPAGIPKALAAKLNAEIVRILELPEVKERLLAMGAEANPSTPEEIHRYIRAEVAKWEKAAKAAGIERQ